MNILAILRLTPGVDTGRVASHIDDEVRMLWHLYTEGIVTRVHLTDDPSTVVLLLDTPEPGLGRRRGGARSRAAYEDWVSIHAPDRHAGRGLAPPAGDRETTPTTTRLGGAGAGPKLL